MTQVFDLTTKTGDIVIALPQASVILKKHKIDFCCGGNRVIAEVADKQKLDIDTILQELNELYHHVQATAQTERNWGDATNAELVEQIVNVHHDYLRQQLPDLAFHVAKIMRVHADEQPELAELNTLYLQFQAELESHMFKEENEVFPLFLELDKAPSEDKRLHLRNKVRELEGEHDVAGDLLRKMRDITNDYTLPLMACMTYQLTFKKLIELESDMFQHIHLENNILFRRLED